MRKTMATSEPIVLGKVGENEVNKVLFPVRGWKELYGDGQFGLVALLPGENDPYPVPISEYTLNGEFVEWVIKSSDVAYDGRGKVELRYSVAIPDTTPVEYKRVKSVVYDTIIWDALGTNSLEPPEPWQPWIDDVEDKAVRAEDAAEAAETAQGLAEDARDAAEDARDDARDARDAAEGYKNDAQTAAQNAQGAVSTAFGQITATATTLSPGSSATASFDPSTKVMSFGIPRGDPGSGGGGDGVFWATAGTTTHAAVLAAVNDGKMVCAKSSYGYIGVLAHRIVDEFNDIFEFSNALIDNTDPYITYMTLNSSNQWATEYSYLARSGVLRVGSLDYLVDRKALAITENGVTTTYYVADITTSEVH